MEVFQFFNRILQLIKLIMFDRSVYHILYWKLCKRKKQVPKWFINLQAKNGYYIPELYDGITKLNINTYDGLHQAVHPDVILIDYKYIMVVSPYPYSDEQYENPCLYTSDDKKHFSQLASGYPLVIPQNNKGRIYLSDPALIVHNNETCIYYRECAFKENDLFVTSIYKISSKDFVLWNLPKLVHSTEEQFICPNPIVVNGNIVIYYVTEQNGATVLNRCIEAQTGVKDQEHLMVTGIPAGYLLWHIDIVRHQEQYVGLFTVSQDMSGSASRLFCALSNDYGRSWLIGKEITLCADQNKEFASVYKGTIVIDNQDRADLFVSAMTVDKAWHLFYIENYKFFS